MKSWLNEEIVLVLNSLWQPVGWSTPSDIICALCTKSGEEPRNFVIDVITDPETKQVIDTPRYTWDEWCLLPLESRHLPILTRSGAIRCPTLVTMTGYSQMPVKGKTFSPRAIRDRDNNTCQVSGRKLKPGEGNMGHLIAKAKGGKRTFDNIVYMDKHLNLLQGTRTVEEMGWSLIRPVQPPKVVPACFNIGEAKLPEQNHFIV